MMSRKKVTTGSEQATPGADGTTGTNGGSMDGPVDEDDPRFVGVREEVQRLQAIVETRIEVAATALYEQAARLFAVTLDCPVVDAILDLPSGQTLRWTREDAFMQLAASKRVFHARFTDRPEDPGRALDARQKEAAHLLGVERLTRTEVATRLGVDRRTIYNWSLRPSFRMYQEQLEREEQERRNAAWRTREVEVERDLQEVREVVVKKAKEMAEAGDPRVVSQVLARMLA